VLIMGVVVVGYIGMMDYVTGPVALLVFYLIPVCFVAWFAGRAPGLVTAFAAASAWGIVKILSPDAIDGYVKLLWNVVMRFGVFGVSSILTAEVAERNQIEGALRRAHRSLEARVAERTMELARTNAALEKEVLERTRVQANLKLLNEILEERVAERSAAAEQRASELAYSENALRQQKGILQSMLNSMGDGVIVADAHGEILLCNPACERFMRAGMGVVSAEKWMSEIEHYFFETMIDHSPSSHPLLRAIRGEIINGAEFFLRGPEEDSEGIWLTATGRPLLDEKGKGQGGVVVLSDITARKSLEKQIAEISDREQRRIGQDLHDGLCQHLVSIAFAGELLREKLERRQLAEAAQAEAIVELVNEGISEARNLARGLYPVRLEVDGLSSALEELASRTQERTGIICRFTCDAPVLIFDEVAGSNLYRITQEAMNNAVKHAECQTISIGLGAVEEEVTLTIKDDGAGFTVSESPGGGGMGLLIMKYRAKMIGASLDIRPGYGGGTVVICSFHNEDVVENKHVHSTQI
jgi:signal transduction histidine kinase